MNRKEGTIGFRSFAELIAPFLCPFHRRSCPGKSMKTNW